MARIGLDASYIFDANPTGTAHYSRRLIESLAALPTPHQFSLCYRLSRWRQRRDFLRPEVAGGRRMQVRLYQDPLTFWLPWRLQLFHSLAQRPSGLRFKREVVTIHDVFPITGPDYSTPDFQRRFSPLLRAAIERADLLLVLSQYTASQLIGQCKVDRGRIRVVPGGVDLPAEILPADARLEERAKLVGPGSEMVLTLGVIDHRKNLLTALRTLQLLPANYKLVLAGGDGYGAEKVHEFIAREKLQDRVRCLGYVPAARIPILYQAASVLHFPSLEEGFGFPLLEAMAYGVPVAASGSSALPEVGGDAALYADPRDAEGFAAHIQRLAEDVELRKTLIARGRQRAARFTWSDTAQETLKVYQELVW